MIPLKDENPTRTFPFVTISLIAINVVVFIYELFLSPEFLKIFIIKFGIIPTNLIHNSLDPGPAGFPNILTMLTSTFLHGSVIHVGGNMLFLWIFGNNIEDTVGHFKFILFYFVSALVAGFTQSIVTPYSNIPLIGASGAVAGVLGAYLLLFPQARILTLLWLFFFIRLIKVPAIIFLGLWFLLQIMYAGMGGGIAWFAHIGGFIAGMVMIIPALIKRKRIFRFR